jgi:hypothetical protein
MKLSQPVPIRNSVKFSKRVLFNYNERYYDEDAGYFLVSPKLMYFREVRSGDMCLALRMVNSRARTFINTHFKLFLVKEGFGVNATLFIFQRNRGCGGPLRFNTKYTCNLRRELGKTPCQILTFPCLG